MRDLAASIVAAGSSVTGLAWQQRHQMQQQIIATMHQQVSLAGCMAMQQQLQQQQLAAAHQ
jgi:hypothetical protein